MSVLEISEPIVLIESAEYTATQSSNWYTNRKGRALVVTVDCTVDGAAASVVPTVEGRDHVGGAYTMLAMTAVADVGKSQGYIFPGAAGTEGVDASAIIPREFRVTMTHADSDAITYSVGATILP